MTVQQNYFSDLYPDLDFSAKPFFPCVSFCSKRMLFFTIVHKI